MTQDEIISQFLKKNQRILHLGCGQKLLKDLAEAHAYTGVDNTESADLQLDILKEYTALPSGFDYVIIGEVLEFADNPIDIIEHVRLLAKSTIVYEHKYDEDCVVDPNWKQPWKTLGLENFLTRKFDYVNSIFLGYATLHICEMPNTRKTIEGEA